MNDESTPKGASETAGRRSPTSVALTVPKCDEYASRVDGAFVVVVKSPNSRLHRRVYLTVASAQRAVDNATKRGRSSRIILAELRPLFDVTPRGGE